MQPSIVLVGAGLSGLSCALHLKRPYLLLEKDNTPGGLARTFKKNDFLFDCTGHWLHFRDQTIQQFCSQVLGQPLLRINRRATIFSHGIQTPYPFQANTYGLPLQVVADCLLGFFEAKEQQQKSSQAPKNFQEYLENTLGKGINKHFLIPYNKKLWTVAPSEMSAVWCERFVPKPSPEEIVYGALSNESAQHHLGYNATFFYPQSGGIGALANAMATKIPTKDLIYDANVDTIDWRQKKLATTNGSVFYYQDLVSSIPLVDLVDVLIDAPEVIVAARQQLRAISVTYWDIGVKRANRPTDPHWMYCPEPSVPFYRAGSTSQAVPSVAPKHSATYYAEVSHPRGSSRPTRDEDIVHGLQQVGLLQNNEEIVVCQASTLDCAYVLMDHNYGHARKTILDWLQLQNIHTMGRYGQWTYDSMEGALQQGRAMADNLNSVIQNSLTA